VTRCILEKGLPVNGVDVSPHIQKPWRHVLYEISRALLTLITYVGSLPLEHIIKSGPVLARLGDKVLQLAIPAPAETYKRLCLAACERARSICFS
jgi:hypothetical protein